VWKWRVCVVDVLSVEDATTLYVAAVPVVERRTVPTVPVVDRRTAPTVPTVPEPDAATTVVLPEE